MVMRKVVVLVVILLGLTACSSIPVVTDFDTARDFSALKTYAWLTPKQKLVVDPLVDNDLMTRRIQRSVEAELKARGYIQAEGNESVDFLITFYVSSEDKISISSFHGSYGYYPCWGGCYGYGYGYDPDIYVRQYKQGTFMLDVIDPASERLMWRGAADRRLTTGTPQERDDHVRATIGAILAEFPPNSAR